MQKEIKKIIGERVLTLTTGEVALQANGAVVARYGDTMVLSTCVVGDELKNHIPDFLPLTVEYREKTYAVGRIPGGFIKREGKPSEKEILTARLIDRPVRPLIPPNINCEIQIISWVLSADQQNDPDFLSINATSAALAISEIPFDDIIGAVRVGYIKDKFTINPTHSELENSMLDIVIAGTEDAIVMVEGGGKELPENLLVEAIKFAHPHIKEIIYSIKEMREEVGKEKLKLKNHEEITGEIQSFLSSYIPDIESALKIKEKSARRKRLKEIVEEAKHKLGIDEETEPIKWRLLEEAFKEKKKKILRKWIAEKGVRIDGRNLNEIREIECKVSVLPRTHGSALFKRGETTALVVTTLGTREDEQIIEALTGEFSKRFMLHYNFPPFSVGEIQPIRGPGRREIGHGALAEKAILPLIPDKDKFPYTIRVVSDILDSNGSSSMATVCGASMSLMDAGVPIKTSAAGVAMGLIKEDNTFFTLTDILGEEDHLGDMDFKLAGTKNGFTAVQMDIKIKGITYEMLNRAIEEAKQARLKILNIMDSVISNPRSELSPYAPRVVTLYVKPERIKDLIGPAGKNIKSIIDQTNAKIDIENDGKVYVYSNDKTMANKAIELINQLTQEPEVGKVYLGKVKRVTDFGAFVEILPGIEGLVHISQLDKKRVKKVTDAVKVGDEMLVKVTGIDEYGRVQLSRKQVIEEKTHERRKKI